MTRRLSRTWRLPIVVGALAVSLVGAGVVLADSLASINTSFTPNHADQVTNLDVLRLQIKNYYGDPTALTGTSATSTFLDHCRFDPATPIHPDSAYAQEASDVAAQGGHWLAAQANRPEKNGMKAIVLDVDDTTLATWNYELCSNWDFNPATNGDFVVNEVFPAVPGMVDMVNAAADEGYAVFFITGRGTTQEAATLGNLTSSDNVGVDAGYPTPTTLNNGEDGLFTKPARAAYPQYLLDACAAELAASATATCTTIHYKSATRAHIESLGYDIVASFGDQFSDLEGGFADKTFKMPNPNYYLP